MAAGTLSAGSGSVLDPVGTVLFVDDEPFVLSALLRVFARIPSVRPLIVPSGNAALDVLKRFPVDVIVTDQNMPGITGNGLLATCSRMYPTMARVLLTGHADRQTVSVAATDGAADFVFAKPWDDEVLTSGILSALAKAGKRRRSAQLQLWGGRATDRAQTTAEDLVTEMESRDPAVASHCWRVAEFTRLFGEEVGLSAIDLYVAALLHDIGKVMSEEKDALPQGEPGDSHPITGQTIVLRLTGGARIAPWIRNHHERFDGSGFPDALRAGAIPLGARVLRVVDAYDKLGLTGMKPDDALQSIMQNAGAEFDPRVANRFVMNALELAAAGRPPR